MSGVLITGELLLGEAALTDVVPAEWIVGWNLPEDAPIEAIVVSRVSRMPFQLLASEPMRRVDERVQVTIRASSGEHRALIEKLAVRACADKAGEIAGFEGVSVLYAGSGPDFMGDAPSLFLTSFDLRVSFLEPA